MSATLGCPFTVIQFKSRLQHLLSKLSDPSTVATAHQEILELISSGGEKSTEYRGIMLYHIQEEFNVSESTSMKPCLKKELVRLVAKLAEWYGSSMVDELSKISSFFTKRIKDTSDSSIQLILAESFGKTLYSMLEGEKSS